MSATNDADSLSAEAAAADASDQIEKKGDDRPVTAEPAPANSSRHILSLDGVRGLAILLVMVSHTTVMTGSSHVDMVFRHATEMGWSGVDLFFVLSGFLITGILFDHKGKDHYFRNFYARRTLRIFPLYYAFVFVILVIVPHCSNAKLASLGHVQGSSIWYWFYLSNIKFSLNGFDNQIMGVSWSLAVEEHFYLVWPLIVLLFSRRALLVICGAIVALALGLRCVLVLNHASAVMLYVLTPCRMDSLAMGAALALIARRPSGLGGLRRIASGALVVCALAVLVCAVTEGNFFWTNPLLESFGFTFLGLFYAGLLVLVLTSHSEGLLNRFFSWPFMRVLGKYSYCLYLTHAIFRSVLRDMVYKPQRFAVIHGSAIPGQLIFYFLTLAASLLTAILSWYFFESRFLKMKRFFSA